ncbi:hypothetical protein [Mycolicibacterium komossense]|uniref:Transmembrane protein n=1 Tax=Mycolicibacterium komossense TaxID=1779 RepID=A0ABT3C832_9MYCO|nr:hypothetical protein [Mycolicibacterium komossense]MCV7225644.1 hypothetical protein [Mycolicibacterium komossense]
MSRTRRWAVPGYALALAVIVTAPLWAPGYLLLRDAVSTPRSYLSDAALGLTEAAPRALPQDFAIALASQLVDGGLVVKVLLLAGLWSAGWGAARLTAHVLPEAGLAGQLVAVTVAIWNPYVAERLLQGHWSLLVGYGALPWVATTMLRLRCGDAGRLGGLSALAFWIALAGLTPTGLLLAAMVALVCVAVPGAGSPRWLCAVAAAGFSLLGALPWLVASAVTHSLSAYQASGVPGVGAFAARAEPGLGTLGSLAGLGGIWNAEAVPGSRSTVFAITATIVLLAVVAAGVPAVLRHRSAWPLLALAVAAVVLPALMASGPGLAVLRAVVEAVPGLGVLRDGQKWVALAMPAYALAAGGAVLTLSRARPGLPSAAAAVACCAAVVLTLPDLAWGAAGRMTAVQYPPGWTAMTAQINADPRPVAVLPADSMRQFRWSGEAPVLDPLPRWIRADVLTTGDLTISGHTILGEGANARAVQELLLAGSDPTRLREAGVGWLVVESGTGGEIASAATTLAQLPVAYHDADITLYRVGGDAPRAPNALRTQVTAAHLIWLAMLVLGAAGMAVTRARSAQVG